MYVASAAWSTSTRSTSTTWGLIQPPRHEAVVMTMDTWKITPQEPGSFYIGNFSVANHYVEHAAAAEPPVDGPDVHITVTLRTDIFATGRMHGWPEKTYQHVCAPSLRSLISKVVARFVSERPPHMPSLTDALESYFGRRI